MRVYLDSRVVIYLIEGSAETRQRIGRLLPRQSARELYENASLAE